MFNDMYVWNVTMKTTLAKMINKNGIDILKINEVD